ncbi:MAG: MDR family MFS transporter [Pseudomonadota bacterium]|nr:MDR family MFS transporter [Pseudomonadota bacterium]
MTKTAEGKTRSKTLPLTAVAALLMLAALDQTIVTTALPKIVSDLGSLDQLSLVVTSYLLTATISAPIYGKMGDIFGRKAMIQVAIIIFICSSLLAAMAQNMTWILIARAAQGLGGGGLFVLAFTVVGDIIPSRERGKVQGLFAVVFGLSSILGPLLGGFFVDELTWHWIFLINIPVGILALIILQLSFKTKVAKVNFSPDYFGILLLALVIGSLILITTVGSNGSYWGTTNFNLLCAVCLISAVCFIFVELNAKDAIVPLNLFRINNFWVYSAIGLISSSILFSVLTFIPFYLQIVKDFSPTRSGFQIITLTAGISFGAIISGIIMTKTGKYKLIPFIGAIFLTFGLLLMSSLDEATTPHALTIYLSIIGFGLGPQLSVITTAIQNSAPPKQLGVATSTLTLLRQVGSSVGVTCLTWLFISQYKKDLFYNQSVESEILDQALSLRSLSHISESDGTIIRGALTHGIQIIFFVSAIMSMVIIILSLIAKEIELKAQLDT